MLKLIGAHAGNPLVALIYGFTSLFLIPFVGLVNSPTIEGMVLEISSMFTIMIYALIAVAQPVTSITETTTSKNHTIP